MPYGESGEDEPDHMNTSTHTAAHCFMLQLVEHMQNAARGGGADTTADEVAAIDSIANFVNTGGHLSHKNNDGDTALYLAAKFNGLKVLEFLLRLGADPRTQNNYGETPIHAVGITPTDMGGVYNQMIVRLLTGGADLEAMDNQGLTPLDTAIFRASQLLRGVKGGRSARILSAVRALLDNGASLMTDYCSRNLSTHSRSMWAHGLQQMLVNEDRRRTIAEADSALDEAHAIHRAKMHAVVMGGRHARSNSMLTELEEGLLECIIHKVEFMHSSEHPKPRVRRQIEFATEK